MKVKAVQVTVHDDQLVILDDKGRLWKQIAQANWQQVELPEEPGPERVEFHKDLT